MVSYGLWIHKIIILFVNIGNLDIILDLWRENMLFIDIFLDLELNYEVYTHNFNYPR